MKSRTKHSLATAHLFAGCSKRDRQRLDALSTPVEIRAGVELTTQGRTGNEFGVLLDGTATVSIDGEQIATIAAGDHYGEVALLGTIGEHGRRRTATVTADCDLWVAVASVQEFATLVAEFPSTAAVLHESASRRTLANAGA